MTDIDTVTPCTSVWGSTSAQCLRLSLQPTNSAAEAAGGCECGFTALWVEKLWHHYADIDRPGSVYSGFTVVVPNGWGKGYSTFRWVTVCFYWDSMGLINPRRAIKTLETTVSGDFIMDRYNSIKVKFGTSLYVCSQILYLGVQFHAC